MKLTIVEWHEKHATYAFEWNELKNQVFVGPGENSYGPGWTAIMVGKFDKWTTLTKQVWLREHNTGYWISANSHFGSGPRGYLARNSDTSQCLYHFLDTVYHTWLNDLILRDTVAAPDGAKF